MGRWAGKENLLLKLVLITRSSCRSHIRYHHSPIWTLRGCPGGMYVAEVLLSSSTDTFKGEITRVRTGQVIAHGRSDRALLPRSHAPHRPIRSRHDHEHQCHDAVTSQFLPHEKNAYMAGQQEQPSLSRRRQEGPRPMLCPHAANEHIQTGHFLPSSVLLQDCKLLHKPSRGSKTNFSLNTCPL